MVRGGLDRLAAGRPGTDPLPRLDSRPVQAELPVTSGLRRWIIRDSAKESVDDLYEQLTAPERERDE